MTDVSPRPFEDENIPQRSHAPFWIIAVSFGTVAVILFLLGWGLKQSSRSALIIGSSIPEFTLTASNGTTLDSQVLRGKVLVINFWASWCQPCQQEATTLQAAWKHWQPEGQVVLLGINYDDDPLQAAAFLNTYGITYPNALEQVGSLARDFGVSGVPTTYLVNADGVVVDIMLGPFLDVIELQQWVLQAYSQEGK